MGRAGCFDLLNSDLALFRAAGVKAEPQFGQFIWDGASPSKGF
jgi:hypothetical protein